eukprot:10909782-Lingulodinium_polyedra.AAC.1
MLPQSLLHIMLHALLHELRTETEDTSGVKLHQLLGIDNVGRTAQEHPVGNRGRLLERREL